MRHVQDPRSPPREYPRVGLHNNIKVFHELIMSKTKQHFKSWRAVEIFIKYRKCFGTIDDQFVGGQEHLGERGWFDNVFWFRNRPDYEQQKIPRLSVGCVGPQLGFEVPKRSSHRELNRRKIGSLKKAFRDQPRPSPRSTKNNKSNGGRVVIGFDLSGSNEAIMLPSA